MKVDDIDCFQKSIKFFANNQKNNIFALLKNDALNSVLTMTYSVTCHNTIYA